MVTGSRKIFTAVSLACVVVLPSFCCAAEENGEKLVEQARCYMCHRMQETLLGPPFTAIALRHSENREVMEEVLALKIIKGGGGNWGLVPMVPNQWVSVEEARIMARWILEQSDQAHE